VRRARVSRASGARDPRGAGDIERWLDDLRRLFADRLLPVDAAVAERWGELAGAGRTLAVIDGLLTATALVHGLTLVTRKSRTSKARAYPSSIPGGLEPLAGPETVHGFRTGRVATVSRDSQEDPFSSTATPPGA
jgi:hypothetical protein